MAHSVPASASLVAVGPRAVRLGHRRETYGKTGVTPGASPPERVGSAGATSRPSIHQAIFARR